MVIKWFVQSPPSRERKHCPTRAFAAPSHPVHFLSFGLTETGAVISQVAIKKVSMGKPTT